MSFDQEYLALREKRLKKRKNNTTPKIITAPERKTTTSKTATAPTVTTGKKRGSGLMSRMDELPSPVKTYTPPAPAAKGKEKNDRTWFKPSSYLADGSREKGDITKAILGTVVDAGEHIVTSVPRMAETGLDALAMIGTAMSKADTAKANFNMISSPFAVTKKGSEYARGLADMNTVLQKEQQKNTADFVKKDIIDEEAVAKKIIGTPFEKHTGINVDEASVLGDKSGSAIQSAGQMLTSIGLQAAGVPMPLTMGLSAFGSQSEKALNEGATFEQAAMSAAVSAGAEVLSEYLSGGIKVKLPGQAASQTLDDILIKPFTEEISNKVLKSLANIGIDAVGEGFEEIFSGVVSNLGEALYKEENIGELIGSKEALDEYIESFIAGMVLGGGSSTVNAVAGRNSIELSENEQKVVDKVVEDRIAEETKDGKKLTKGEETKIRKAVLNDMLKGAIDTDTIESVLGGEDYKAYKDAEDNETAIQKEFDSLNKMKQGEMTGEQIDRRAELKQQLEELKSNSTVNSLKTKMSDNVSALVKDSRLLESYNEKARRRQSFEADLTKYNTKQQDTVKKAIESGILNNTRRTHDFVDMIAKISADKGVSFDFTSNDKLKESGFAIEGKTVNGLVTKDGIKINVNSAKALNSVVGHEITHILEGTELYSELQTMLKAVAESKGEYQTRYDEISKLYEDIEGADIEKELTADLVGDYLFTDSDFVNRLSTEKPGVFKKIFDEIKYLCRVAASGSKEAKELEKVKRVFEKAYKESVDVKNTADEGGVSIRYNLSADAESELHKALYDKNYRNEVLLRDETPSIMLSQKGVKNHKMVMNASHIRENVFTEAEARNMGLKVDGNTHYHGIGEENFLKIIDSLDDVKEAYRGTKYANMPSRRENYFLLVSEFKDENGNTINVPVYIEEGAICNRVYLTSNKIATVFGRDDFRDYINQQIKNKNLIRIKNKNGTISEGGVPLTPAYESTVLNDSIPNFTENVKRKQLEIIEKVNPAPNTYNTWIRKVEDIKTLAETLEDSDWSDGEEFNPDLTRSMIEEAIESGEITVYSSYPIEQGVFVSPSYMEAASYSGDGNVYEKTVKIDEIAWIDPTQGMYANTAESYSLSSKNTAPKKYGDYAVYGEDVMLEGEPKPTGKREFTAPTRESIAEKKKAEKDKLFPMLNDDIPVRKERSDTDANINSGDTTPTRDKAVLIERYKKRAEVQLVAEKEALKEIYDQRKAELYEEIKDKNAFISKKAKEFYDEISSLRKGVKASKDLGYFLDFGFEWSELKSTFLKVSKWPDVRLSESSTVESVVREAIGRDYEDKSAYGFDDLDTEYCKKVAQLEADTVKRIEEYKAREFTRSGLHTKIVDGIKAKFTEKGFDLDKVLSEAKNLSTFSTVDNTPQRVMEKALGYKPGQILADATVNKVAQNESEGIKWLNSFTDRKNGILAQISKKYNIKPGSKESAAAQMYAEGFYVNEINEIIKYGDRELALDFSDAKVRNSIKGLAKDPQIRQIYDETLAAINESRSRNLYPDIPRLDNYFLHFRAMEDTFSRLGLPFNPNDIRAKDLPTDLNGVTADLKPGQPYFASAKHREGLRTSFDLLGGLERYLTSAKNQIYHIDDIQTLRALRNYIADSFGQAKGLGNLDNLSEEEAQERIEQVYGSHLSTFAKFLNEEANVLAGKTTLIDRGLEGIIGRRGISFLNTVNGQVGSNMVGFNISSSLTNILPVVQTAAKTNKGDFVKALAQTASDKLNSLKGKSDGFKENSPVIIRRKGADRFYRTPYQKFGDAGYILMSAVDDVSTEIIARTKYNELTRKGMDSQQAHFETDKWVSRLMGDRSLGQMPQLYNSKLLGVITKFQLEVRNQLDSMFYDTVQEAKISNEEIENRLKRNAKTAAKVSKTIFELAVLQHGFGWAFEQVAGYNPAFDIIEVLIKTFGLDDDEDDEDTVLDNIEEGFFALLEDLPYTSTLTGGRIPISSALPINELINGKDQYGNEKSRGKTLADAVPYYLLPTGFGQIKKSAKGLKMFDKDLPIAGSYTDSGNLRFPVEKTPGNVLQAAVFGQYANKNAQSYFDEGYEPLKEKQIQEFKDVGIPIADYWKYIEGLSGLKTLNEKGDYIGSLDLPTEKKNILINNIADRKTPIDMSDYDKFPDFEVFDFAKKNPELYKVLQKEGISVREYKEKHEKNTFMRTDDFSWAANNPEKYTLSRAVTDSVTSYREITSGLYDIRADKDKYGKSISGSAKRKKKEYIWSLDIDDGAKYILFRNEYKSDDTYNGAIINYLNGRNDISYEDKKTILTELDFKIDDKGRITWD